MPRLQIADHRRTPTSFEPQSLVSISNTHEGLDHHGRHTPTKVPSRSQTLVSIELSSMDTPVEAIAKLGLRHIETLLGSHFTAANLGAYGSIPNSLPNRS
ncbi:hypothetical protein RHGRI_031100 [Rhododendron griersonianum]|uniref:Uncharacterized protein n=1 Tax=Rhododendron griersonianum TaxID=479676 RepID=A0AAV6I712_9ERIC|nr:hypothetical protein RHGRI_031100 [Rhododendron griersonianum]